ncbi:hypothetical protein K493DRAFT_320916 [Basidiobolus meristosporus CBS 931.73]|uniref:Arrestin-like N-terminal domain-containing protein n=1 Tax=Basidiobolus meristosporus CBS 931.73 TaxID=1314790 RepID=A0A1Y1X3K5_9FUNG|nr:hypothetical protein K493DRAFT_320916 [Basidiobolus meristosporus CBS 931.73]|eukprot:ORX80282.1 hypothetical protein K493DRAFT_320916 [Basidiobolus meristosporus CBS 931.73]
MATLEIQLPCEEVTVNGSCSESNGGLLEGSILLTLTKPTKVNSITLRFLGLLDMFVESEGWINNTIVQQDWSMFEAGEKTQTLAPGCYRYPFSVQLPGNTPESVECQTGIISYGFVATVERPLFSFNLVTKKRIFVRRNLIGGKMDLIDPVISAGALRGKLEYFFSLPSGCFLPGQDIPVTFQLKPNPALSLESLNIAFIEVKKFSLPSKNFERQTSTEISSIKLTSPVSKLGEFSHFMTLRTDARSLSSDCQTSPIDISHMLQCQIALINRETQKRENLSIQWPVVIISNALKDPFEPLPVYISAPPYTHMDSPPCYEASVVV